MTGLAVTGYASLDYVMLLAGDIAPDKTTRATRNTAAWPRAGGCPTYIARAVAAAGLAASPVMWLGADAEAGATVAALTAEGIATGGIAMVAGARSPAAVMLYEPGGACSCLFDPGLAGRETLNTAQRDAIARASHLCISVGPPHLTRQILQLRNPEARLYWAVKDDPACFGPELRGLLGSVADVIFCSAAERGLIDTDGAVVVQTQGARGVRIEAGGEVFDLAVSAIATQDTTGAGDTFAGGFIAAEMAGATSPEKAARAGIAAAARLLTKRQEQTV